MTNETRKRKEVLNTKHQPVHSMMRFQCIAVGSYLVKSGRKTTLMLSAKQNGDSFWRGCLIKDRIYHPYFKFLMHKLG